MKRIETLDELMRQEKVFESYERWNKIRYSPQELGAVKKGRIHNRGWFQNWNMMYAQNMVEAGVLFTVEEKHDTDSRKLPQS